MPHMHVMNCNAALPDLAGTPAVCVPPWQDSLSSYTTTPTPPMHCRQAACPNLPPMGTP